MPTYSIMKELIEARISALALELSDIPCAVAPGPLMLRAVGAPRETVSIFTAHPRYRNAEDPLKEHVVSKALFEAALPVAHDILRDELKNAPWPIILEAAPELHADRRVLARKLHTLARYTARLTSEVYTKEVSGLASRRMQRRLGGTARRTLMRTVPVVWPQPTTRHAPEAQVLRWILHEVVYRIMKQLKLPAASHAARRAARTGNVAPGMWLTLSETERIALRQLVAERLGNETLVALARAGADTVHAANQGQWQRLREAEERLKDIWTEIEPTLKSLLMHMPRKVNHRKAA